MEAIFSTRRLTTLAAPARDYLVALRERLLNPYLAHRLSDIAQNHAQKKQRRFGPVIAAAEAAGLRIAQGRLRRALATSGDG